MDNNSSMLAYGFSDEENQVLNSLCREESLNFKIIKNTMANMKVKDIVSGLMIEVYDKEMPEEKAILFNNIEDHKLEKLISRIRANENLGCILAVVTKTSKEWTFKELLIELLREREWYRKNSNKRA
ncbi:DUF3783 domain-containing protein [Clostridium sp. KNHs214]|uniref:DUF3783 domain-containing protein n=1 Tax=Clostridium sp. KNHs214 TaxID=1540257 RepID=UPI00054D98FB|nr:DUF3783 domain-containing protein [Clostridium sp. KNHs214]